MSARRMHPSRYMSMIAGTLIGLCGCSQLAPVRSSGEKLGAPVNPRCEYAANPLGIDVKAPRLSWEVNDTRRGAVQSAYQIVVHDVAGQAVWDTGKVDSDQSIHVVYQGKPLQSGCRYAWKVRTWDGHGRSSDFSEPAWWEMGLLRTKDWTGRWIAPENRPDMFTQSELIQSQWIWHKDLKPGEKNDKTEHPRVYFRGSFHVDPAETIEKAVILAATPEATFVYMNGVANGKSYKPEGAYRAWPATRNIVPGKNVIAVAAHNLPDPGGLLIAVEVWTESGKKIVLNSDGQWKSSLNEEEGWNHLHFDDSAWSAATVVADYGAEPRWKVTDAFARRVSYCLRRDFTVSKPVTRARVYASGLGCYELQINGRRVGEDILNPNWTHYAKTIQYQTFEVTNLLRVGDNAIGAMLGNGWYCGDKLYGYDDSVRRSLRMLVQMNIEYADGTRESVVTDGNWRVHRSPIVDHSIFDGEVYDARLEMPGWSESGFDATDWSPAHELESADARLVAQQCETIRVTEEIKARRIVELDKRTGTYLFDFGQNAAGWVRLKVRGPRGTKIRLRFAEEIQPEGRLYRANLRTAEATDFYILKGEGEEIWEPRFTYHGFRYCEVKGFPGVPDEEALIFRVLHSNIPRTGTFVCSDWLINQIHENTVWGQRSNLHGIPTDCPQRDERMGWTGDGQIFARTACWNMRMARFFAKWQKDILDSGNEKEGWVTDIAPVLAPQAGLPGWGDAVTIVPWVLYQFYGDRRIIEDSYPGMVAWVEFMRRNSKDDIYTPLYKPYGDWVAVIDSPRPPIAQAYYYYSTHLLARMAAAIGKTEDARKYSDLAEKAAAAFNKIFLDHEKIDYPGGTQTANLLPLAFGMVPAEHRQAILNNIVRDIDQRDDHLSTGFLGTPLLLPTLTEYGQNELAYRLATQSTCPSWGYMVRQGATTIWELWDADVKGPDMNSRNHFVFGSIGEWFYQTLAGINPDPERPGFKRTIIRPRPAGDLIWARGEYHSMYGTIQCAWQRSIDGLMLLVRIPANTSAVVDVPTLGRKNIRITEQDICVFADGRPADRIAAVQFRQTGPDYVRFEVAAGSYVFEMRGD